MEKIKERKTQKSATYTIAQWQENLMRLAELNLLKNEEYTEMIKLNRKIAQRYAESLIIN